MTEELKGIEGLTAVCVGGGVCVLILVFLIGYTCIQLLKQRDSKAALKYKSQIFKNR